MLLVSVDGGTTFTTVASGASGDDSSGAFGEQFSVAVRREQKGGMVASFTAEGLLSSNSYYARVRVANSIGASPYRMATYAAKPASKPPSKVQHAVVSTVS